MNNDNLSHAVAMFMLAVLVGFHGWHYFAGATPCRSAIVTRGRYMLGATLWLARQLREGRDAAEVRAQWLVRRRKEVGYPLADARRSFRAAVESAARWNEKKKAQGQ